MNPIGDGNCGFRVLADYIFGDQNLWLLARKFVYNEVSSNSRLYEVMYGKQVAAALRCIKWEGGECGPNHWMAISSDLYPIATLFNAVVYCFTDNINICCTVFPLQAPLTLKQPQCEIVICHLGKFLHYIRLNLCKIFHVPPIMMHWHEKHESSVNGWDKLYYA